MRPADLPRFSTIGERIRYWRERREMSRTILGKKVGLGYSSISDIELGNTMQPKQIHKYAKALKVGVNYLETDQWEDVEEVAIPPTSEQVLDIDPDRLEQLNAIEREYISMKVNALLDQIESARPRAKKSRRTSAD